MKTEKEIRELLEKTLRDDRLSYPPAKVDINAPLALVQVALETKRDLLKWILEENK